MEGGVPGEEGVGGSGHDAAAEPEGAAEPHGEAGAEGVFEVELDGAHLFGVEAEAGADDRYGGHGGALKCVEAVLSGLLRGFDGDGNAVDAIAATQFEELIPVAEGFRASAPEEGVDGRGGEAGGRIAADIDGHHEVAHLDIVLVFVLGVDVDDLHHDGGCVADVGSFERGTLDGDAYDDVGAHPAGEVGGVVVAQPAIDEDAVADAHGCEDSRDGHGGPHGPDEAAATEIDFGIGDEVGGHAGEGNGEAVEADAVEVAAAEPLEESHKVASADESALLRAVAVDAADEGVGVLLFALMECEFGGVGAVAEEGGPVLGADEGVEVGGGVADGVECADEGAHGGAADDVDGDTCFFDGAEC